MTNSIDVTISEKRGYVAAFYVTGRGNQGAVAEIRPASHRLCVELGVFSRIGALVPSVSFHFPLQRLFGCLTQPDPTRPHAKACTHDPVTLKLANTPSEHAVCVRCHADMRIDRKLRPLLAC